MAPGQSDRRRVSPLLNELLLNEILSNEILSEEVLNELRRREHLTRRGLLSPNNLLPARRHRVIGLGSGRLGLDVARARRLPTWMHAGIVSRTRAAETRDIADRLLNMFGTSEADRVYPPLDLPLVVETEVQLDWIEGEPDPWLQPEVMAEAQAAIAALAQRGRQVKLVRGKPVPANRYDPALAQPASAFGLVSSGRPVVDDQLNLLDQAMPVAQRPGFLHVVLAPRAGSARSQAASYPSAIHHPGRFASGDVPYGPALRLIFAPIENKAEDSSSVEDETATFTTAARALHPRQARSAFAPTFSLGSDARVPASVAIALPSHTMARDVATRFRRSPVSPIISVKRPLASDEPFLPGAAAPPAAPPATASLPSLPPPAIQRQIEPASVVASPAAPGLLHGFVAPTAMHSASLWSGAGATLGFPDLGRRPATPYGTPLPLIFPDIDVEWATEPDGAAEPRTSHRLPLTGADVATSLLRPPTRLAPGDPLAPGFADRMTRLNGPRPPALRWPERIEAPAALRRTDTPEPVRIVLDWVAGHNPWQREVVWERAREIARSLESQGVRVQFVRGREVPPQRYVAGQPRRAGDFSVPGPTGPVVLDRLDVLEGAMLIALRPGLLHVVAAPTAASIAQAPPSAVERLGLASGFPGTRMAEDASPWAPLTLTLPPVESESDADIIGQDVPEESAPATALARGRETRLSVSETRALGRRSRERDLLPGGRPRTQRVQVVLDWVAGEDPWRSGSVPTLPPNVARDLARRGVSLEFVRGRAVPSQLYEASQGQPAESLSVSGPRGPVTLGALRWLDGAVAVAQRPGQLHLIVAGPRRSATASPSPSMPLAQTLDVSLPLSRMPSEPSIIPGTLTGRNDPLGLRAASGIVSSWIQGEDRGQLVPDESSLGLFDRYQVVEEPADQAPGWPAFEPLTPAGFGETPPGVEDASTVGTGAPATASSRPPSITPSRTSIQRTSAVATGRAQWPTAVSAQAALSRRRSRAARSGALRLAIDATTAFDAPDVGRSWTIARHEIGSRLSIASQLPLPSNLLATRRITDSYAGTLVSSPLPPLSFADAIFMSRTPTPSVSSTIGRSLPTEGTEEVMAGTGRWPVPAIAAPMNVLVFDVTPAATEREPLPMASPSVAERPSIGTAITQVDGGASRTPAPRMAPPGGRPDLPPLVLARAAAPDVLPVRQQDVARAETGRPTASAPQSTAAPMTTVSVDATQSEGAGAKAPNLDVLARQVYGLIKRRLVVERERTGMSRGVRPW